MKNVCELDNYELLYIIENDFFGVENTKYFMYDVDDIWREVAKRYENENKDIITGEDRVRLYQKLYESEKYNLLNILIKKVIDENKEDSYFYDNFSSLYKKMFEEYMYEEETLANLNSFALIPMDKKEVENTVIDILDEIDPCEEWSSIYKELIKSDKIFYINELDRNQHETLKQILGVDSIDGGTTICNFSTGEIICMFLDYNGTISDLYLTIHEVIHYINRYLDKGMVSPILKEFPSLFYELYTLEYLKKKGYSKSAIDYLRSFRSNEISNAYDLIRDIMYYINIYMRDGIISEENDIGNEFNQTKNDTRIYYVLDELVKNPSALSSAYPYIIGGYLANKAINMDDTTKSMIKYINENLSKIRVEDVFNILENDLGREKTLKKTIYDC